MHLQDKYDWQLQFRNFLTFFSAYILSTARRNSKPSESVVLFVLSLPWRRGTRKLKWADRQAVTEVNFSAVNLPVSILWHVQSITWSLIIMCKIQVVYIVFKWLFSWCPHLRQPFQFMLFFPNAASGLICMMIVPMVESIRCRCSLWTSTEMSFVPPGATSTPGMLHVSRPPTYWQVREVDTTGLSHTLSPRPPPPAPLSLSLWRRGLISRVSFPLVR